jgi:hypothetical protein
MTNGWGHWVTGKLHRKTVKKAKKAKKKNGEED